MSKYKCSCIPTQKSPHIATSSSVKARFVSIPWGTKRNLVVMSCLENLTPAISCDGHPVPLKRWELWIGNYKFSFGKLIY